MTPGEGMCSVWFSRVEKWLNSAKYTYLNIIPNHLCSTRERGGGARQIKSVCLLSKHFHTFTKPAYSLICLLLPALFPAAAEGLALYRSMEAVARNAGAAATVDTSADTAELGQQLQAVSAQMAQQLEALAPGSTLVKGKLLGESSLLTRPAAKLWTKQVSVHTRSTGTNSCGLNVI
jgi:hypothetical protein